MTCFWDQQQEKVTHERAHTWPYMTGLHQDQVDISWAQGPMLVDACVLNIGSGETIIVARSEARLLSSRAVLLVSARPTAKDRANHTSD